MKGGIQYLNELTACVISLSMNTVSDNVMKSSAWSNEN